MSQSISSTNSLQFLVVTNQTVIPNGEDIVMVLIMEHRYKLSGKYHF